MPKAIHGISVSHFFETYREKLRLELLTGDRGLHRLIREGSINRPALALTGFFRYFANKRIQVLGAAEMTYLKTLSQQRQKEIFTEMAERQIPCVVLTRNYNPTRAMLEVAQEKNLPLFKTPMITMNWVNLGTLCIDNEFAPSGTEHATTLDIRGVGVMLRGQSGVGKSECALALIERGHSLVADDYVIVTLIGDRELQGTSKDLNRGYMECRGIGIINVASIFGVRSVRREKRVDLVVTFVLWQPGMDEERSGLEVETFEILGRKVPHMTIPVRPGRDMARLVEVASSVQALRGMGHDSAKEFSERLIQFMAKGKSGKAGEA